MFVRGVHPIDAPHPCCLIEIELPEYMSFDWGMVTQEMPDLPRSDWQVAWDERFLNEQKTRWAFFFHYLDLEKPLITPVGVVMLPPPTPLPNHLAGIRYEPPC